MSARTSLFAKLHAEAIVAAFALIAWWPLLIARPPVADDFYNAPLFAHGLSGYWARYGIWRILGHGLPFLAGSPLDRWLALAVHIIASILLLKVLRRIAVEPTLALATASLFAVLPFGFQALTWNSAVSFALAAVFALALALAMLRPIDDLRSAILAALLGAFCAFASLCSNEATLLLIGWIGLLPLFTRIDKPWLPRVAVSGAVLLAEVAWIALHLLTKPAVFHKNPGFHAAALVSGLLRQISQATYLTHLAKLGPWITFGAWMSASIGGTLVILILRSKQEPTTSRKSWPLLGWLSVLPFAAVAIYALSGGFSTDARKAYVLWPFLLIALAGFAELSPRLRRSLAAAMLISCPIFIVSSQATTAAWNQSAAIFAKAYAQIRDEHLAGPFRFEWKPNIYEAWPDFDRLCGFRLDSEWVVDTGAAQPAMRFGEKALGLTWNEPTQAWEISKR